MPLRERMRAELPPNVIGLMDEIEGFANLLVGFEPNPNAPVLGAFNPNAAQTTVRHDTATIYLRGDASKVDAQGIAHELLHIQRYWLEQVPQLHPLKAADSARHRYIQTIENEIEHAAIIPRERALGLADESTTYWNATARKKWAEYPWAKLPDAPSRRDYALWGRLQLEIVTDPEVRAMALAVIQKEGVAAEAERFAQKMMSLAADKPRAASCAARFLGIPREQLRLIYFDVRNRSHRVGPLPAH